MAKTPSKNGHASAKPAERPPTAYFLSLEVENVRCFGPKQKLDLSDGNGKPAPWTIILGVNGTGKTTLLQLLTMFEIEVSGGGGKRTRIYSPAAFVNEIPDGLLRTGGKKSCEIRATHFISHQLKQASSTRLDFDIEFLDEMVFQYSHVDSSTLDLPLCVGYGAGRRVGILAFLEEVEEDSPRGTLFSDNFNLRSPEEWLLYLDYTSAKKSNVQEQQSIRRDQAINLLKQVLWEISDIRFIPGEGVRPKPRVEFKTPYGWVPFRQLGYGYQSLATWVADFASRMVERYPESKNPLEEPAVVLVDEIDLHLHPKWQRELMDRLTNLFPNTQFIATAHSPLIAQAAANLAVLRRVGDHVIIDNDVEYIRNWRVDQILTSDLFGLDSARPPHIAKLLAERDAILGKAKLTKADEKELKRLEAEIGELPVGESKQQRQEMDRITKALDRLLEKEGLKLE
ncbi:MAG: AAA family ATPase [Gemmataceae bacterium]|nr:AAA family ATPase [Gemmataceae bacterium]